jgi:ATP-binding cassette subfamily B protein
VEKSTEKKYSVYRRLLKQARNYWKHIVGLLVLSLLSTPLALLFPLPLKIAIDSVIGSKPLPEFLDKLLPQVAVSSSNALLLVAVSLALLIAVLQQILNLGSLLLRNYTGEKMTLDFRARLFRHAQRLSLSTHDSKGSFDTLYRINQDAPAIQWAIVDKTIPMITLVVTLVSMIYVTARINSQLALVALAVSPIIFLLTYYFRPRLRRQWKEVWNLRSSALSVVQEALNSIRVVKAFGQEDWEEDRFVHRSIKGIKAYIRVAFNEGTFNFAVGAIAAVGAASVLFLGVRNVQAGSLTVGDLLVVMSYLTQIYMPLKSLGQEVAQLQGSLASADRAFSLLDEPPEVINRPNARRILRAAGAVTFNNVTFNYNSNGGQSVLHNISFEIRPGTRLGIAGKSGAGKTTLLSLLVRFYDPIEGQILLDSIDLRDYHLSDLRDQFSIVLQEPVLFSTTIAENISYGRPGARYEEIIEAAKAANAHEFITNLSEGYDTVVGERGMLLSGGERQRISLARAFLKNAPILILDEPTSSVDINTEAEIMNAMEKLMGGRTTFLIAHRLSTLENCDEILIMEDGRLAEVSQDVLFTLNRIRMHNRVEEIL